MPVIQAAEVLSGEEAAECIMESDYFEEKPDFPPNDPLGIAVGSRVSVESADSAPGAHPQFGTLAGLTRDETIIGLENGIRLHFPRAGYIVRRA